MICSNPFSNINLLDMYSLQLRHPEIIESNSNRILCMKQFMFLRAFSIFLYLEWISTKIMALILFCIHFLTVQQCTTMNQCCWQTSMSAMEVGYVYIGHQGGMSEIRRPSIPTLIPFGFLLRAFPLNIIRIHCELYLFVELFFLSRHTCFLNSASSAGDRLISIWQWQS